MHSTTSNPARMMRVDTAKDTLKSWIYAPSEVPEGHGRAEQSALGSLTVAARAMCDLGYRPHRRRRLNWRTGGAWPANLVSKK
jgi:hypothetical protein